jgi:hypothetical protein
MVGSDAGAGWWGLSLAASTKLAISLGCGAPFSLTGLSTFILARVKTPANKSFLFDGQGG